MPADERLPPLEDELALLTEAVAAAAERAIGFHGKEPKSWHKANNSPVSEADIAVETLLEATLRPARPSYGWLSEETADDGSRLTAPRTFIVDPIDGTRDFVAVGRNWSIPIALVENGRPVAAVLMAPARGEIFRAIAGGGATLNGKPIHVSAQEGLDGSRLAITRRFTRDEPETADLTIDTPFFASLAYRLARIADGRLDGGLIRPDAQDWDLAAADLLLHEAGGSLADLEGKMPRYDRRTTAHPVLVAATPSLVAPLVRLALSFAARHGVPVTPY
ncbi:MAG: 3'(2'),5'-bisphosphate nucleotidase CysQ [Bauldia sp.]|nr:3'(2'),5'-bisphosphate nucleotidase CysQ [Bauldia sp.]